MYNGITVMQAIDLNGSWKTFVNAVEKGTGVGPILNVLGVVGVIIVLFAVVKWAWDRRRGGGMGQTGNVWGALLVGALFAAPKTIIPIFLIILDLIANAVLRVWDSTGGKAS